MNRLLQDYAARIEKITKRVDRLETLEFSSAAFPSGGIACFETVKLAAPANSVALPSVGVLPATFWHLWLWYTASTGSGNLQPFLRFNGDSGANYRSYKNIWTRDDDDVDTMASVGGSGAFTDIDLMPVGQAGDDERGGCEVNIYDYAAADRNKAVTWKGWNIVDFVDGELVVNLVQKGLGGGEWLSNSPITSLTVQLPGVATFRTGSVFTLIGVCTK